MNRLDSATAMATDKGPISHIVCKGLVVVLSVGLCVSVASWLNFRRELRVVTRANEFLRKTLGDMTIAIVQKDREIDRLEQASCNSQEK